MLIVNIPIILWVIFLKKIIKTVLSSIICVLVFLGVSFGYLKYNFGIKTAQINQKADYVPYQKNPSNCGITFIFPKGYAYLFYLDFKNLCINVVAIPDFDEKLQSYNGYTNDFQMYVDSGFVEGIIDHIGGIDLTNKDQTLRYTGSQVIDYLENDTTMNTRQEVISQIFKKFSKNDFSKDDFVYIIENSESNLDFIDGIYWIDYLKDMSQNVNFENF